MNGAMGIPAVFEERVVLREVTVRPVRDAEERRRWDALVSEFHYLPFHGLFGQSLRHVAVQGETWVALLGWTAGAFKVAARDGWIGWSRAQQFRRLKLIANNARFVVLTGRGGVRNLASRVLGLSLRRLSRDMHAAYGFPVLLAETFVDPSRFRGTCYRASNWRLLGWTRGFTRLPGSPVRWRTNGQPKEIYVYELQAGARAALGGIGEPVEWRTGPKAAPMPAGELRSLYDCLAAIPDFRQARGRRYSMACYLTVMIAARLAGYRGVSAFGEFAARLDEAQRKAVGGFFSPARRRYTVPAASTFHYILSELPADTLDQALRAWSAQHSGRCAVAMDGKEVRGASKRIANERRMMVAAVEHGGGLILGQVQVGGKSNEITAVRALSRQLNLKGRIVTLDALHAQQETARCLTGDCGADYVITAVKGNQQTIHDDLADIDWSAACWSGDVVEKGHGRIETRRCAAVDLTAAKWNGWCDLFGRRQAVRIERERIVVKTGKVSREVAFCLTSLSASQAGPEELLNLVRRHWEVENRVHYVRDFSYGEDRCRASVRNLPQNLAALSNAAISIVRIMGQFQYIPPANRHYAARPQEALDAILTIRHA